MAVKNKLNIVAVYAEHCSGGKPIISVSQIQAFSQHFQNLYVKSLVHCLACRNKFWLYDSFRIKKKIGIVFIFDFTWRDFFWTRKVSRPSQHNSTNNDLGDTIWSILVNVLHIWTSLHASIFLVTREKSRIRLLSHFAYSQNCLQNTLNGVPRQSGRVL